MGVKFFDIWAINHFVLGFISTLALEPNRPWISLIATNLIHFAVELLEVMKVKKTELENWTNKISDAIWFFLGSLLSIPFMKYVKDIIWLRIVLLLVSLLFTIQEVGREIFPQRWPIDPAFQTWFKS